MQTKENKEAANAPLTETNKENKPLSETIENAHASGDGALERDKDTIIPANEGTRPDSNSSPNSGKEAY